MLTRRTALTGAAALAGCAHASAEDALLARAIVAGGGEAALTRAAVLAWTGEATIHAGGRRIEIGVDTVVVPFQFARSRTWLREQGPDASRTLEIDPTGGWAIRNGQRNPLPPEMLAHEREQFAIYGLMRLVSLRDPGARVVVADLPADAPANAVAALDVSHPAAPETRLMFGADARLVAADDVVTNAEAGGAPIPQRFLFSGTIEGGGVRWPRALQVLQAGQPYFALTLATFTPRASL